MTDTLTKPTAPPFVWQDESGDAYYAEGHIDPWRFFVAVLADTAENCGHPEVMELLGGEGGTFDRGERIEERIKTVAHRWFKERSDNDEQMDLCEATDEGALAFTEISL